MKQLNKMLVVFLLALLAFVPLQQAQAQSSADSYTTAAQYMVKQVPNPTYGDEWVVIGLARGGAQVPAKYFETYYQNLVKEVVAQKGQLHRYKYTEYSRVIIALSAIGRDAKNVGGYDLTKPLEEISNVVWQGVNGPIFALIALDTWQYATPARDQLVDAILQAQLLDGGFTLSGDVADLDLTAMAIQALAPYADDAKVAPALQRAMAKMNALAANGYTSAETAAQVITAYTAMGIDAPAHVQQMQAFYNAADGGFRHVLAETKANGMATEQATYALAAYNRMQAGQLSLYNMQDTRGTFTDTKTSWASAYIDEAVALGLLKGYSDGTFKPNNQLTRTQAISIIVRAAKLTNKATAPYQDLGNMVDATKNEIAAAYEAGLIKYNGGTFNPHKKITRMQLGLILLRAYNVQHAPFKAKHSVTYSDTAHLHAEEQLALAFLAEYGIATGSNGRFNPANPTTRAQRANMSVQFVKGAMQ
ncbi:MAG: S-layer homology domain-containing protein [Lysinibacillus sp.]